MERVRLKHALAGPIEAAIDATRCPIDRPLGSAANAARYYSRKDEAYCAKYDLGVLFPPGRVSACKCVFRIRAVECRIDEYCCYFPHL
jgi:hypothetical protein